MHAEELSLPFDIDLSKLGQNGQALHGVQADILVLEHTFRQSTLDEALVDLATSEETTTIGQVALLREEVHGLRTEFRESHRPRWLRRIAIGAVALSLTIGGGIGLADYLVNRESGRMVANIFTGIQKQLHDHPELAKEQGQYLVTGSLQAICSKHFPFIGKEVKKELHCDEILGTTTTTTATTTTTSPMTPGVQKAA